MEAIVATDEETLSRGAKENCREEITKFTLSSSSLDAQIQDPDEI
jgi:hypothetical protein